MAALFPLAFEMQKKEEEASDGSVAFFFFLLQQNKTKRRGRQLLSCSAFQKKPKNKVTATKLSSPSSSFCYNKIKEKEKRVRV
jgi:hypothetical protein